MKANPGLETELMETRIELLRQQLRWEPWKALAALAAAAALFIGAVLAASTWLHPAPRIITVHLDAPLAIQPTH